MLASVWELLQPPEDRHKGAAACIDGHNWSSSTSNLYGKTIKIFLMAMVVMEAVASKASSIVFVVRVVNEVVANKAC